jgi:ABC-type multidrug transport system fused ATPase/permease subunit
MRRPGSPPAGDAHPQSGSEAGRTEAAQAEDGSAWQHLSSSNELHSADRRDARSTMRSRLEFLIGNRRRLIAGLAGASVLSGFTEAAFLAIVAQVAAKLATKAKTLSVNLGPFHVHTDIGTILLIAVALAICRLVLQFPLAILPARIAAEVQAGFRKRLFNAYTRASWGVQSLDREGQLQDTMTLQVMQASGGALQMTALIISLITFIVLLISAFALNVIAAAVVLGIATVMFGLLRPLRAVGERRSRGLGRAQLQYAAGIAEAIRLAQEAHVFGAGAAQRSRISRLIGASRELFFRVQVLAKLTGSVYQSMIYLLVVAALYGLYLAGPRHAGALGAVVLLLVRASSSGQGVQAAYQGLIQSMPFIERIETAERRYRESTPPEGHRPLARVEGLAFEHVSFAYRTAKPVLRDLSFEVEGSEAIGIVGPSGAGKSTLIQILLRLRSPDAGRYLVNGVPAGEFSSEDWHTRYSYVPQEPRLLHASVSDNIRFFRDLDDEAVERAGRLARIHDDVMSWSDGYQTLVGPRADAVSGGQQQRICLARALAASPEVLVLDEPTSALDPHSETLIQESLATLKQQLALFIIAHRMSTLDICDRVMVIVEGRLVAFDTKALLQEQNPYYRSASLLAAGAAEGTSS